MVIHRRVVLCILMALGAVLFGIVFLAWTDRSAFEGYLGGLQRAYGTSGSVPWYLQADSHLHALCGCLGAMWFGLACRLFYVAGIPLIPVLLMVCVVVADEVAQGGARTRSFEWPDVISGLIGISLSVPLQLLLRGLRLDTDQKAAKSPSASTRRE